MKVSIVTPDRAVYDGEASALTLPGHDGSFQVFSHHAAMISSLGRGKLKMVTPEGKQNFEVEGGAIQVLNDKVTVLVEAIF